MALTIAAARTWARLRPHWRHARRVVHRRLHRPSPRLAATAVTLESAADLTTHARKGISWRRRRSRTGPPCRSGRRSRTGASPPRRPAARRRRPGTLSSSALVAGGQISLANTALYEKLTPAWGSGAMALKIVTGGTTGAADGTLVSSSNKIVFTAIDTVVDAHIRADDDTRAAPTPASRCPPRGGAGQLRRRLDVKAISTNKLLRRRHRRPERRHQAAPYRTRPPPPARSRPTRRPAATALSDVTSFAVTARRSLMPRIEPELGRPSEPHALPGRPRHQLRASPPASRSAFYTSTGIVWTNGDLLLPHQGHRHHAHYKDSANYATANGLATHFVTTVTLPARPAPRPPSPSRRSRRSPSSRWGAGIPGGGSIPAATRARTLVRRRRRRRRRVLKKNTLAVSPGDVISYRKIGAGGAAITQPASNVANSANGNAGATPGSRARADVLARADRPGPPRSGTNFTGRCRR